MKKGSLSSSTPVVVLHHAGFSLRFHESRFQVSNATGCEEDAPSSTKWLARSINRIGSHICYAGQFVSVVSVVSERETPWPVQGMLSNHAILRMGRGKDQTNCLAGKREKCREPSTIIGKMGSTLQ
jgi:hypothetical protein